MPLIDTDSLWKIFENANWWNNADRDIAQGLLSQAPSVDAEPIRHGHWIWCETWSDEYPEYPCELIDEGWSCSVCGKYLMRYLQSNFPDIPEYAECTYGEPLMVERCPHCGTKMDEYDDTTH